MRRRSLPHLRPHLGSVLAGGLFASGFVLAEPAAAHAAQTASAALGASLNPLDWISDAADKVGDVALGPLNFGVKELAGILVSLLIAIADLLVPDWLVNKPLQLMTWIVAVPDWTSTRPNGKPTYPGIESLRGYLTYFGVGLLGVGITWSGVSTVLGNRSVEELIRTVVTAVLGLVFYRYGWDQGAALMNTITKSLLSAEEVKNGLAQMLAFAGGGAFLAAGTIFAPILVIAAATALIGVIAAKAALILLSALVYIFGGFAFCLLVFPFGRSVFRAWSTAAGAVFGVPLMWSALFAVSGVLINDAMKQGQNGLVEGGGTFGTVMASVMLAITGVVTLYIAIKMGTGVFGLIKSIPLMGGASGPLPGTSALRNAAGNAGGSPGGGDRGPATAGAVRTQLSSLGDTLAGATGLKSAAASMASSVIPGSAPHRVATAAAGFAKEGVWGPMGRRADRMAGGKSDEGSGSATGPTFVRPGAGGSPSGTADTSGPATAPGADAGSASAAAETATASMPSAAAAAAGAAAGGSAGVPTPATSTAPGAGSGDTPPAPLPGAPGMPGASASPGSDGPTPQSSSESTPPRPTTQGDPSPTSAPQPAPGGPAQTGGPAPAPGTPQRTSDGPSSAPAQGAPGPAGPAGERGAPGQPAAPAQAPPSAPATRVSDAHQAASDRGPQQPPTPPGPPERGPQQPRPDVRDQDR